MQLMPGTTLSALDETDADTLLGYVGYQARKKRAPKGQYITFHGKRYKKANADNVDWL